MRNYLYILFASSVLTLLPAPGFAPVVPGLDLSELCDHADLIAVGRAALVRQGGGTTIVLNGRSIPARLMFVELDQEKILKGPSQPADITFSFRLPSVPIVSFGHQEVLPNQFGVFFLRKIEGGYEVLDPYHPFVIAAAGAPPIPGDLLDQVTSEVAHVLHLVELSSDVKEQAVLVLTTLRTPVATAALQAASRNQPTKVRLAAIAALLARNDISELGSAEDFLLRPPPRVSPNLLVGLAYAIRDGVKDPRAIPTLARMLQSSDTNVRIGAASALRNTQDSVAIKPLNEALSDNDREVQYQAVIGLAEITGAASEWSPATDTFNQNPQKYLDYWREWSKSRK